MKELHEWLDGEAREWRRLLTVLTPNGVGGKPEGYQLDYVDLSSGESRGGGTRVRKVKVDASLSVQMSIGGIRTMFLHDTGADISAVHPDVLQVLLQC